MNPLFLFSYRLYINLLKRLFKNVPSSYLLLNYLPKHRTNIVDDRKETLSKKIIKGLVINPFVILARYNTNDREFLKESTFEIEGHRFNMLLNVNEYTQCNYFLGNIDPTLIKQLKQFKEGTFIDIGANVGFFSIVGSHFFKDVYSFEPTPRTFSNLTRNVKTAEKENVHLYQMGLSNAKTTLTLTENPMNQGGNSVQLSKNIKEEIGDSQPLKTHEIEVDTLDSFIERNNIQDVRFIKLDVEGHEEYVLKGAAQTLQKFHPSLFIEAPSLNRYKELEAALPKEYVAFDPETQEKITDGENWNRRDVLFKVVTAN